MGTNPRVDSSDPFEQILPGLLVFFTIGVQGVNPEEFHAPREFAFCVSVAQDAIVSDLHEAIGQDVQEKPPDELEGIQSHQLHGIIIVSIPISEGDPVIFKLHQPVVR